MKASFEKLALSRGQSFRCFDRRLIGLPARWHRHPEFELTYVPRGDGSRLVGDHLGTYVDHDLVLLGSNVPHTWASDEFRGQKIDRHEGIVIQFHPDFLGRDFFEVNEMEPIRALLRRSERGLWYPTDFSVGIGKSMTALTQTTGPGRLIGLLSILECLSQYSGAVELATPDYVGPTTSASESRLQTVCEFTHQNFTDASLGTRHLAEHLQMNASAFCRFFKQSTGLTPSAYVNELRIGFACRRLLDSDRSILDVCYDSGFSSTSHFNETFRKLRGMSPRKYRAAHKRLQSSVSLLSEKM